MQKIFSSIKDRIKSLIDWSNFNFSSRSQKWCDAIIHNRKTLWLSIQIIGSDFFSKIEQNLRHQPKLSFFRKFLLSMLIACADSNYYLNDDYYQTLKAGILVSKKFLFFIRIFHRNYRNILVFGLVMLNF
jgi:hypothetical protein